MQIDLDDDDDDDVPDPTAAGNSGLKRKKDDISKASAADRLYFAMHERLSSDPRRSKGKALISDA